MSQLQNSPSAPYNRAGLPAIVYRISDYHQFRERLLAALSTPLLSQLTSREQQDWAIALLDAFAIVGDVLTFYQERIANEGYLLTATERFSVLQLARSIGYELNPGVAASTYVTFTVDEIASISNEVIIPKGTQFNSVPGAGELPQTFETIEEIIARADGNAIRPRSTRPQTITTNTRQLYLSGINTRLQVGERVLLIDAENTAHWLLLRLTSVETNISAGYTRIIGETSQMESETTVIFQNPQVFAFRQLANLFGYNAPRWETISNIIQRAAIEKYREPLLINGGVFQLSENNQWSSVSQGLPNQDILCVGINSEGTVFVGTAGNGVLRLQANTQNWQSVNTGLTNLNVQTLFVDQTRGFLLAGTTNGGVFRSRDDGENWVAINLGTVRVESQSPNNWESINTALPNTVIRSLIAYEFGNINYIFAGTDDNIYRSDDQGKNWYTTKDNHPSLQGLPDRVIYSLAIISAKNTNCLFAGTEQGIYHSSNNGETWEKITNHYVASAKIYSLAVYLKDEEESYLFAGTDGGIYYSRNKGDNWETISNETHSKIHVYSLAIYEDDEKIYISGATNQGIFTFATLKEIESPDWKSVNQEIPAISFTSIASQQQEKKVFAGSRFQGFGCKDWPGYQISEKNQIDLDTLYPQILAGSWMILFNSQNQGLALVEVKQTTTISRQDFSIDTKVTRVATTTDIEHRDFGLRSTIVFGKSEQLPLAAEPLNVSTQQAQIFLDPISEKQIFLSQFIPGLKPDQRLMITGKPILAQVVNVAGVFYCHESTWSHQNQGLTNTDVRSLISHQSHDKLKLYAGTGDGVFERTWSNQTWTPLYPSTLTNKNIQTLTINSSGDIFAGTPDGIFRLLSKEQKWTLVNQGFNSADTNVKVLIKDNQDTIFAGTASSGVYRSTDKGNNWIATGLTNVNVQALAISPNDNKIVAGTFAKGIFYSTNGGNSWTQINEWSNSEGSIQSQGTKITKTNGDTFLFGFQPGDQIKASGQVRTIVSWEPYQLTVDLPFQPDILPETPFSIGTGLTNLNITALLCKSPTEIFAGTSGSGIFYFSDDRKRWQQINTGILDLEIHSLAIDADGNIFAGTSKGGIFQLANNNQIWKPQNSGLNNTDVQTIMCVGEKLFASGSGILIAGDNGDVAPLHCGDILQVVQPPTNHTTNWQLLDRNGFAGELVITNPSDLLLLPANNHDIAVSEVGYVDTPPINQQFPVLTLKQPLKYSYDPATVTISANVALSTHGETTIEILGSGSGTIANQTFTLPKLPLTYIAANTATGSKSTLEIRVNQVLWEQVASLHNLKPQDRNYVVRMEDDGTTKVIFGDGTVGTRLPTGEENIQATYRTGMGIAGEVKTGSLTLLNTRPLGVVAVTNPLPATGAAEKEKLADARIKAPASVRHLDRIVSLTDFEDFTQVFVGIGKAQAVALRNNGVQIVHITIAGIGGKLIMTDSNLYQQLVAAIDANRDPIQVVQVDSYQPSLFNLEAKVLVDSRYQPDLVLISIRESLKTTFAFEERDFGQSVTDSEVIATIQAIDGVIAVDLDALYNFGSSRANNSVLTGKTANWNRLTTEIQPAQLLLLNPTGIQLKTVPIL